MSFSEFDLVGEVISVRAQINLFQNKNSYDFDFMSLGIKQILIKIMVIKFGTQIEETMKKNFNFS